MINTIISALIEIFHNTISLLLPIYKILIAFCIFVYVYQLAIYLASTYYKEKNIHLENCLKIKVIKANIEHLKKLKK